MSVLATSNEVTYTWSGQLPPRHYKNPTYSTKVFLGGVPWDITESMYNVVYLGKIVFGCSSGSKKYFLFCFLLSNHKYFLVL